MSLSGPQKTKWLKLRAEIIKRPFLAFIAGLSYEEIMLLLQDGFPSAERLEQIDNLLLIDRKEKTERLRPLLSKRAGNRGSVRIANKLGISDSTMRGILDKKYKLPPSYDLLGEIETYLHYTEDLPLSIEQLNASKFHLGNKVGEMKKDAWAVVDSIRYIIPFLDELKESDKKVKHNYGDKKPNIWAIDQIDGKLESAIETLKSIKADIKDLREDYCQ